MECGGLAAAFQTEPYLKFLYWTEHQPLPHAAKAGASSRTPKYYALANVRIERKLAPVRVSATTAPASRRIARVASAEISDSP